MTYIIYIEEEETIVISSFKLQRKEYKSVQKQPHLEVGPASWQERDPELQPFLLEIETSTRRPRAGVAAMPGSRRKMSCHVPWDLPLNTAL